MVISISAVASAWNLAERGMKLPLTLGHETVGEVVATGAEAKGVKIGSRVLAHPWIGCGSCGPCRRGAENLMPRDEEPRRVHEWRLRRLHDRAASTLSF